MTDQQTVRYGGDGLGVTSIHVEVTTGPDRGKAHTTESERFSIGTDSSNDLVLTDDTVSRFHLDLIRKNDGIVLQDHNSTNGTVLAGARIMHAIVPSGTTLKLGKTTIQVRDGEPLTLELLDGDRLESMIGSSPVMRQLMAKVRRVGRSNASIIVLGETGSGKEVVAQAVHRLSDRADGPFETVDCGAMLPTLIASELFGHERGAFTGAEDRHIGAFERADGGTLFLDEIGELPLGLQAALLGVLERREFRRVGGKDKISVDVRLLSATNRDLKSEVNTGTFRADLYYRIAVISLEIPPLRDRVEDIPLLAEHFARDAGYTGPMSEVLPEDAMKQLAQHKWPGNVRELRNTVEAALVVGEVPTLTDSGGSSVGHADLGAGAEELRIGDVLGMTYPEAKNKLVDAFEKAFIQDLMERYDGNITKAATASQVSRQYLTRMLKRHGVRTKRTLEDGKD